MKASFEDYFQRCGKCHGLVMSVSIYFGASGLGLRLNVFSQGVVCTYGECESL